MVGNVPMSFGPCHLKRHCRSWLRSTMSISQFRIISLSGGVRPLIEPGYAPMEKTLFHPVTGFVRMTGCTAFRGLPTFSGWPRASVYT